MGVSTKRRRKILVDGDRFLWWVAPEDDNWFLSGAPAVTVCGEDRALFVRYHLGQPDDSRHVTVLGPRFRDVVGCGGPWRRFLCPCFDDGVVVRPSQVASLIRWTATTGPVVEVDYQGCPIGDAR